jgi:hypothetical protein
VLHVLQKSSHTTESMVRSPARESRPASTTHVGVHGLDLIPRRSTQDLDDLYQLVDTRLSREEGLTEHQFGHYTTG